jgi:hypothetical protein
VYSIPYSPSDAHLRGKLKELKGARIIHDSCYLEGSLHSWKTRWRSLLLALKTGYEGPGGGVTLLRFPWFFASFVLRDEEADPLRGRAFLGAWDTFVALFWIVVCVQA